MNISINGKFVDTITLTGTEPEFGRAYGVFETIRTYHGRPFALAEHLERLAFSAQQLQLTLPYPIHTITDWVKELCQQNHDTEMRVKVIAGIKNIYILGEPLQLNELIYCDGVKLKLYALERTTPTIKNLAYWQEYLAHETALREHYYDALLINAKQQITEGAYSNFFCVKDNIIYTAPTNTILAGITRKHVLQLAQNNYTIIEQSLEQNFVLQCDECWLTQTSTGIVPVIQIDEHVIGDGKLGIVTNHLIQLFNDLCARN